MLSAIEIRVCSVLPEIFLNCFFRGPGVANIRAAVIKASAAQITKLEDLWKDSPNADFEDLDK